MGMNARSRKEPRQMDIIPNDEVESASSSEGARIFCSVCGARPWPAELGYPEARQTVDLLRLSDNGAPAESPAPANWYCERRYKFLRRGKSQIVADE
jgi:hypothetical protein